MQISTLEAGSEDETSEPKNVDWNCQRRFEFYFLIRGFITFSTHTIFVVKSQKIANTISKPEAPANAEIC